MMIMFFKIIRNLGKSEFTNPFKRYKGHPSYLGVDDLNFIDTTSKANPSLYLDEVRKRLADVRDVHSCVHCNTFTSHRFLPPKLIEKASAECNEEFKRYAILDVIGKEKGNVACGRTFTTVT